MVALGAANFTCKVVYWTLRKHSMFGARYRHHSRKQVAELLGAIGVPSIMHHCCTGNKLSYRHLLVLPKLTTLALWAPLSPPVVIVRGLSELPVLTAQYPHGLLVVFVCY